MAGFFINLLHLFSSVNRENIVNYISTLDVGKYDAEYYDKSQTTTRLDSISNFYFVVSVDRVRQFIR